MSRRTSRLAVAATVTVLALTGCGAQDEAEPASETVALTTQAAPPGARCATPTAELLADNELAFEGTVTELGQGRATLEVDRWFVGGTGDLVTVAAPSQEMRDLLLAVEFREGRTYLVTGDAGKVTLCGFSAEATPELEALYEEAFGQ